MALFDPCMEFEFFLGQMTRTFDSGGYFTFLVSLAHSVPRDLKYHVTFVHWGIGAGTTLEFFRTYIRIWTTKISQVKYVTIYLIT